MSRLSGQSGEPRAGCVAVVDIPQWTNASQESVWMSRGLARVPLQAKAGEPAAERELIIMAGQANLGLSQITSSRSSSEDEHQCSHASAWPLSKRLSISRAQTRSMNASFS
jgi:hypothetical protein